MTMRFLSLLIYVVVGSSPVLAASPFKNSSTLKTIYNFGSLYKNGTKKALKVAVLDKGFTGFEREIGETLPENTIYISGPVAPPADLKVEHGLRMAQILYDLASDSGKQPQVLSELRLYNVFGFSNLQYAIQDMIDQKVDLVLYSEVWEFGNNFDGRGFINSEIKKALDAGVLWVNAAGNFGQTTFNSEIKTVADNWVALPDQNDALALRCQENSEKKCQVKIVLSWNDFKDESEIGTDKDLDLALSDDLLNIVGASRLKQTTADEIKPGETKYAREIVSAELKQGLYFIRVKRSSDNFGSKDRLRISVDGENISMPSADKNESLLNPADQKGVISVGAWDSQRTSISVKMKKPDLWALSSIIFEDKREFRGSSNSAAIAAAAMSLLKSQNPKLSKDDLFQKISFNVTWNSAGLPLQQLGFRPKEGQCFQEVFPNNLPTHMVMMMARGAKLVETNYGLRLMTPYDPLELDPSQRRNSYNDLVLATPQGLRVVPRMTQTGAEEIEVFQNPSDAGPCFLPQSELRFLGF